MADEPVPKEERDRVFRKLLAKADNRTCFDCPQRKPIWASSTFGVFICLDCAGGQRRRVLLHCGRHRRRDVLPQELLRG